MLYRKAINELLNWKNNDTVALLVDGARQVGKTRLIEEFIKTFNNYIEIDFTKDAYALSLLLEVKNYDDFVNRLSLISKTKLSNKDDILFLDEIQYYYEIREKRIEADSSFKDRYVDIVTLSKEIANRKGFRLIMSGSMLGVSIFSINLNPTGYLKQITMYPMDFEEFLLANDINQALIDEVKDCFYNKKPVSETLNEIFLEKFKEFIFVGGYPAAVQGYINDRTLSTTYGVLETIDSWYKQDILKYAKKEDRLIILEMYNILANEITMKNKKFVKSHLDVPNFKNLDLNDRFLWLKCAGIAIPVYNVTNPVYPLRISQDNKIIKLFMCDSGLLTHHIFDVDAKKKLMLNSGGVDLGAIYENAVASLLVAHGYNPYFHSTKKRGEIDFIVEKNMAVIPIEIKSSKPNNKSMTYAHQALNNLLLAHNEIKEAWVFGINNVKKENGNIFMFPIYMIDFIKR